MASHKPQRTKRTSRRQQGLEPLVGETQGVVGSAETGSPSQGTFASLREASTTSQVIATFRLLSQFSHVFFQYYYGIVNPRRACAARVTVVVLCVCLCVCLSVCPSVCLRLFSHHRLRGLAYERYQQLQCYKGKKNNVPIFLKRLRSRDMA